MLVLKCLVRLVSACFVLHVERMLIKVKGDVGVLVEVFWWLMCLVLVSCWVLIVYCCPVVLVFWSLRGSLSVCMFRIVCC